MKKLLVVEDDALNRALIEDIIAFDDVPAELVALSSAEEALAQVAGIGPALILMDVGLPGMDGLSATRALKAQPATAGIPIWIITAHAMLGDEAKARAAGGDDYISKPIDSQQLADRLRNHFRALGP
jgi:two-component system, cell cycle response regulator DivK